MRAHELFEKLASEDPELLVNILGSYDGEKHAGIVTTVAQGAKRLALADVGGPKGFLQPIERITRHGTPSKGNVTIPRVSPFQKPVRSARTTGGAWDVSEQARRMGL